MQNSSAVTYREMILDPKNIFKAECDLGFALTADQLHEIHLSGARKRFNELKDSVQALGRLADEQGVSSIERLEDIVPLLFPHTAYKSYPLRWLEDCDFGRLTQWLNKLTAIDLSHLNCDGIESIDEWIEYLDEQTELRVVHSFGTSGILSFIPHVKEDFVNNSLLVVRGQKGAIGSGNAPAEYHERYPVIVPSYRYGATASARAWERTIERVAGSDENAVFLYPTERLSADVLSLAGRLRAAESQGERGALKLSERTKVLRERIKYGEERRKEALDQFFEAVEQRYGGENVYVFLMWPVAYEWAKEGRKRGIRRLFGRDTIFCSGGGTKGFDLPADYRERVFDFLGTGFCFEYYGMSELLPGCLRCPEGNYHVLPVIVPFVLDPSTGEPLPREGLQTGRYAALNLVADTYWGGIISGDEVTMGGWDEACRCGRTGPYVKPSIRRFSDVRGAADKISCSGVPDAYDKATDYLARQI